ncbi:glutamine amidotransferase [Gracilaria domingensis]|nr:glutamine amidotransferase [Gracilaria domingensis]
MGRVDKPDFSSLTVGVLELQGDFAEHTAMLHACGVRNVSAVKQRNDLNNIDALIIPGGESTVISKLLIDFKLMQPIRKLAQDGLPMFGTCAGLILLARQIRQFDEQQRIGVLDVLCQRRCVPVSRRRRAESGAHSRAGRGAVGRAGAGSGRVQGACCAGAAAERAWLHVSPGAYGRYARARVVLGHGFESKAVAVMMALVAAACAVSRAVR